MPFAVTLIALAVSAAAVFVSITQADTARIKLRYDLFDRRFRVFDAYYELIRATVGERDRLEEHQRLAVIARTQSHFLFSPELPTFLEGIDKEAARIEAQRQLCKDPTAWNTPQEGAVAAARTLPDVLTLMDSFPMLVNRFAPYLHRKRCSVALMGVA